MGKSTVFKLCIIHPGRSVAAKRQYMGKTRLLHIISNGENVLFGGADTGHMGNCRNVETVLDEGSQLHRAFGTAAACAVGYADKIRLQLGKLMQDVLRVCKLVVLLGRKYLKRKGLFLGK